MIQFDQEKEPQAQIKVVGVGGGGGNAVNTMIKAGLAGVEFVTANTDAQAMAESLSPVKMQLGERGLGARRESTRRTLWGGVSHARGAVGAQIPGLPSLHLGHYIISPASR